MGDKLNTACPIFVLKYPLLKKNPVFLIFVEIWTFLTICHYTVIFAVEIYMSMTTYGCVLIVMDGDLIVMDGDLIVMDGDLIVMDGDLIAPWRKSQSDRQNLQIV